jgi:hypothetical protein
MFKKLLWGYLGFIVFILLLAVAFNTLGAKSVDDLGLGSDGQISAERVPQNFSELWTAPAVALLPNRTPERLETSRGGVSVEQVEALLARWENFSPRRQARAEYLNRPDPYLQAVRSISTEGQDSLYRRLDSADPPGVCSAPSCQAGLRWVKGSFGGLEIRNYQANQAYVTGYGVATYQANVPETSPYQGQSFYRSYGLLLTKDRGRWLLTRAAAETLNGL